MLESLLQDVRFGLRMLRKDLAFTVIAALTLALGIGANSTVFSWMNATLLNPIPGISDAGEVVSITRGRASSHAYPDLVDLGERSHSLAGVTGFALGPLSLTGNGKPEQVWGTLVTANYFDVLGVKPALGRGFLPAEDKLKNGAPVAVISYRLWQNRFGGDPSAVGRTIHINTHTYTIVGVAPPVGSPFRSRATCGFRRRPRPPAGGHPPGNASGGAPASHHHPSERRSRPARARRRCYAWRRQ